MVYNNLITNELNTIKSLIGEIENDKSDNVGFILNKLTSMREVVNQSISKFEYDHELNEDYMDEDLIDDDEFYEDDNLLDSDFSDDMDDDSDEEFDIERFR